MLNLNEVKVGKKIVLEGQPFVVLFSQHSKMGRAGAVMRTKLKNLQTGAIVKKTFQGAEKFDQAEIETRKSQYLYRDGVDFCFMNNESFEQFSLPQAVIGDSARFLKDGSEVDVFYFESRPINLQLPVKMDFEVTEAPPAVRGNTADGGSKMVTIETGTQIATPLFVEKGDRIRINTETGQYVERAN